MSPFARHALVRTLFAAFACAWLLIGLAGAAAAAATDSREAAEFYEDAVRRFDDGDYGGAIVQLKNALGADAGHLPARLLIGKAYLALGDGGAAEHELERAREAGGDASLLLVPLTEARVMQGKFEEALAGIPAGDRDAETEGHLLVLRGLSHLGLGRPDAADRAFSEAQRLDPEDATPLVGRAKVAMSRGLNSAAERFVGQAIEIDAESIDAWFLRGELARANRDLPQAVAHYDKTLSLQPEHADARRARAAAFLGLDRIPDALADITEVRARNPEDAEAAYLQASILNRLGRETAAVAALQDAAKIIEGYSEGFVRANPATLFLAARVFYRLGRHDVAVFAARDFIRRSPKHLGARKVLVRSLLADGKTDSAIDALQEMARLARDDPSVLALLGQALIRAGRHAEAVRYLDRAAATAPQDASIKGLKGLALLLSGQPEQASKSLVDVLEINPAATGASYLLAMTHVGAGDFERALEVLDAQLARNPQSTMLQNLAGAVALRAGNTRAARERFAAALAIDPGFMAAQVNLAVLDAEEGNLAGAKARYLDLLARDPEATEHMAALASLAEREGLAEEAAEWLEKAITLDRSQIPIRIRYVVLLIGIGEFERALGAAKAMDEEYPDLLPVVEMLGRTHLAAGNREASAAALRRAAALASAAPDLQRLARLMQRVGDVASARDALQRALADDPEFLLAVQDLIGLEARAGDQQAALGLISALRRAMPSSALPHRLEGDVMMLAGLPAAASVAYQTALGIDPSADHAVRLYLARSESEGGEAPLAFLEEWVRDHPDDAAPRRQLAAAYVDAGRFDEAVAQLEATLATEPDDADTLNNLAWLYDKRGDARALALAERARAQAPRDPKVLDTYGWILIRQGDAAGGLAVLRDAFSRASDDPSIRYHIAVALRDLGRADEAKRELARLLETKPNSAVAEEARALLNELSGG